MRLVVLCPHFAPDTAPTGRRDDPDRRGAGRSRSSGRRRHGASVVPPPPCRAWVAHHRGSPEVHGVGVDHEGQSVPGRRQGQPGPPGDRLCRVLGAGPRRGPRRRRMAAPCRRRHRHVATADDGCHRPARRLGPPLPARVQHPRRVPGRRRRPPGRSPTRPSSPRRRGWSGSAIGSPTPSRCCPTTSPTTSPANSPPVSGPRCG